MTEAEADRIFIANARRLMDDIKAGKVRLRIYDPDAEGEEVEGDFEPEKEDEQCQSPS